jgi:hypothetical protein
MAQKKIKCAVYKSEEPWGGGHYFLLTDNHKNIRNVLHENGFKIARKPIGIFEFEESFLNIVCTKNDEGHFVFWDNTWCE